MASSYLSRAEARSEIARLVSEARETLDKLSEMPEETVALEAVRDVTDVLSLIFSDAKNSSEVSGKR